MAMKIASRKKKIPSIANPIPKASPKRSTNLGQSRPNSKERTVPVTAFDQLRARRSAASSFFLWPRYSAISMIAGKATPKQASTMWNPSVKPIWLRAASRFEEESASRGTRLGIRSGRAYSGDGPSEDCDWVERRSGSSRDAEGSRDEEELPAACLLAGPGQFVEEQVVEKVDTHRCERQHVDGKSDPLRDGW